MTTTLRIVRFGPADCGGSYLAFASDDEGEFYRIVAAIKTLGYAHAQWTSDVRAWWLSPQGLARLCGRYHDLAQLIGEFVRNGGETSGPSGSSDDQAYTSGKRRAGGQRGKASGSRRAKAGGSSGAPAVPADVAKALAMLYVTPDAPPYVVSAAYKALAKVAYPYVQGAADELAKTEAMKRLNLAYEIADAWAKRLTAAA